MPDISYIEIEYTQEEDSCDESEGDQVLQVRIEDAGGGPYYAISTRRWAVDDPGELGELLRRAMKFFTGGKKKKHKGGK